MRRDEGKRLGECPRISDAARRYMAAFYAENPFLALLGAEVKEFTWGRARLDLAVRHDLTNVYGIAHGGVATALADTAMGGACLGCNKRVVTMEMGMNFIRPIAEGSHVTAIGEVIYSGSHTMVCEGRVLDAAGTLCLKAHGTFFVIEELGAG